MQRDKTFGHSPDRDRLVSPHALQGLPLGRPQLELLLWLIDQCGPARLLDDVEGSSPTSGVVIVSRSLREAQASALCKSLQPGSVVVIPFGESPSFDNLKSKLINFGTVSPSGAHGPHELWWGGLSWPNFAPIKNAQMPLIVSCYSRQSKLDSASCITRSLKALELDHVFEPIDTGSSDRTLAARRIQFILDIWNKADRPILWIHPEAIIKGPPSLLQTISCDFSIHRWRGWELSPRTLYFGQSAAAGSLLRTWRRFTESYPLLWEGTLLDQAWSLVASQTPLRTLWLPRSYHALISDGIFRSDAVIAHNLPEETKSLNHQATPSPFKAARHSGRAGNPGPHLLLTSPRGGKETALVKVANAHFCEAPRVSAMVERIASAFVSDPGNFKTLELSVCERPQEIALGYAAAEEDHTWSISIDAIESIPPTMFSDISRRLNSSFPRDQIIRLPWAQPRITAHLRHRASSDGPYIIPETQLHPLLAQ